MNDPEEKKYKQLALFSVIVAEVVVTPCALGGIVFWLMQGKAFQLPLSAIGALLGLCVAIYRVYQIYKIQNRSS